MGTHIDEPVPDGHSSAHADAGGQAVEAGAVAPPDHALAVDEHAPAPVGGHNAKKARDPFKTVLSLLMAIVVVTGAVITWRSTLAGEEATKEDTVGLTASVQAQGARVQSNVNAYQDYESYTIYARNQAVGNYLDQAIKALQATGASDADTKAQLDSLQQARTDSYDLANASRQFFKPHYLKPDGTYDLKGEIGAALSDAAKQQDLQPDTHFEEADTLRAKSNDFLLALLILGAALLCYTLPGALAPAIAGRVQYPIVGLGVLLTLIAIGDAIRVQFM